MRRILLAISITAVLLLIGFLIFVFTYQSTPDCDNGILCSSQSDKGIQTTTHEEEKAKVDYVPRPLGKDIYPKLERSWVVRSDEGGLVYQKPNGKLFRELKLVKDIDYLVLSHDNAWYEVLMVHNYQLKKVWIADNKQLHFRELNQSVLLDIDNQQVIYYDNGNEELSYEMKFELKSPLPLLSFVQKIDTEEVVLAVYSSDKGDWLVIKGGEMAVTLPEPEGIMEIHEEGKQSGESMPNVSEGSLNANEEEVLGEETPAEESPDIDVTQESFAELVKVLQVGAPIFVQNSNTKNG